MLTLLIIISIWLVLALLAKYNKRQIIGYNMMIVLGSGGHSAELLRCLLDAFSTTTPTMPSIDAEDDPQLLLRLINRVYIVADTDRLSASKADQLERSLTDSNKVAAMVRSIPRAREVGQPWMSSAFTFIRAQLHTTLVVWQERPQLIVCNGPGTCVPVCLCVRLFQYLLIGPRCRVVFVESFARVNKLSLTGRLLYPLADEFIVQWPQLNVRYPRSRLIERLL